MELLRALVKRHDFDTSGRSSKWVDPEKVAILIADQLRARLNRGAYFMRDVDEGKAREMITSRYVSPKGMIIP